MWVVLNQIFLNDANTLGNGWLSLKKKKQPNSVLYHKPHEFQLHASVKSVDMGYLDR